MQSVAGNSISVGSFPTTRFVNHDGSKKLYDELVKLMKSFSLRARLIEIHLLNSFKSFFSFLPLPLSPVDPSHAHRERRETATEHHRQPASHPLQDIPLGDLCDSEGARQSRRLLDAD